MQRNQVSLGALLKKRRTEMDDSLAAVEEKTGISRSYINRLENDLKNNPSIFVLAKLIDYYNIPFSAIQEFMSIKENNVKDDMEKIESILLGSKYLFANIEANLSLKLSLIELFKEIENYCNKEEVNRIDEAKILELICSIRNIYLTI